MPRKHGPGCRCCAPCGFNCDPCLGSVTIDGGVCGGATFMYPLTDPCVGIITESDPYCVTSDCVVDLCKNVTFTTALTITDCLANMFCTSIGGRRFKRDYVDAVIEYGVSRSDKISYTITFVSDKRMKIQVVCKTMLYGGAPYIASYTSERHTTAILSGSCSGACSVDSCPQYAGESFSLESTVGPLTCTTDCSADGGVVSPGICVRNYLTIVSVGCSGTDIGSVMEETCGYGSETVSYHEHLSGEAIYEETFDLATCEDFFGTFSLPRINSDFSTTKTREWRLWSACAHNDCRSITYTLTDCWPSTIDVTLA